MTGNEIFSAIRKTSIKHLLLPMVSVIAAVCIYSLIPFDDVFTPKSVKSSAEAAELYDKGHEYGYIELGNLYYTGFDIMSGDEVSASYYYEITNNKCTFYVLDSELVKDKPLELKNVCINVRFDEKDGLMENMITAFAQNLGWTADGMLSITNNVVMNQSGYHAERYVVVYIILMAVTIYSMVLVTVNILFTALPWVHPAMIRYYASSNLNIKRAIKEMKDDFRSNKLLEAGDMYITEKYFYNLGKNEVSIIPLNKLVMGYEHGKLRSLFGAHLKMTHTLYLVGVSGRKIEASGKTATDVTDIIDYIKGEYPDIVWGHTKENISYAKKMRKQYRKEQRVIKINRKEETKGGVVK